MEFQRVATHVVTGFLGVGKTTTLLHWLEVKPAQERWAILVNEFGEVGVDGALLSGSYPDAGVVIREVPGGCICCAAGVPMVVALNQLLKKAKPHHLFIEPTGLGHPKEILAILNSAVYEGVLDVCATLTLVDARKIKDIRYTQNHTFNEQLKVADYIIAHKADVYDFDDLPNLTAYVAQLVARSEGEKPLLPTPIVTANFGDIPLDYLAKPRTVAVAESGGQQRNPHLSYAALQPVKSPAVLPNTGMLKVSNQATGFVSVGWVFDKSFVFSRTEVAGLCCIILAERLKAIFITDEGVWGFNKVDGELTVTPLQDAVDSRIEIITASSHSVDGLEDVLRACIIERGNS